MKQYNILVCGVGGQGVVTVGTLLRQAALWGDTRRITGFDVKGASQREGPVTSTLRYLVGEDGEGGDERRAIHSGTIAPGRANLMIALEPLEALRNGLFLSRGSQVVLNTYQIPPRGFPYPLMGEILERLKRCSRSVYTVDASGLSLQRYGNYRMANLISLGVALASGGIPAIGEKVESLLTSDEREALFIGIGALRK